MLEVTGSSNEMELERGVEAALFVEALRVERQPGPGTVWDVQLKSQPAAWRIEARVEDTWLMLEAWPDRDVEGSAVDWIACNDGLAGGARLALGAESERPHLRAEIPLDIAPRDLLDSLRPRLSTAWRGFSEAFSRTSAPCVREPSASARSDGEARGAEQRPDAEASAVLARRLGELGWTHSPRGDGSYSVDLEVGEGFSQANVAQRLDGTLRLRVAMPEASKGACRDAVATLLMRCSGWVRMVRAASDADHRARLEVELPEGAGDAELSHALCALSVAMRLAGDEVALLSCSQEHASLLLSLADRRTGVVAGRCPTND